jgi:hypothetical protein
MWRELLEDNDLETVESVDLENSFFIGDAGGREAVAGTTVKDHSCVDRYAAASERYIATREYIRAKATPEILQPTSAYHFIRQKSTFCNRLLSHS